MDQINEEPRVSAMQSVSVSGIHLSQPAPLPPANAWTTKSISYAAVTGSASSSQMDKNDQHDSGIDVSDLPNSAESSTRSSPSAENKLKLLDKVTGSIVVLQEINVVSHTTSATLCCTPIFLFI